MENINLELRTKPSIQEQQMIKLQEKLAHLEVENLKLKDAKEKLITTSKGTYYGENMTVPKTVIATGIEGPRYEEAYGFDNPYDRDNAYDCQYKEPVRFEGKFGDRYTKNIPTYGSKGGFPVESKHRGSAGGSRSVSEPPIYRQGKGMPREAGIPMYRGNGPGGPPDPGGNEDGNGFGKKGPGRDDYFYRGGRRPYG